METMTIVALVTFIITSLCIFGWFYLFWSSLGTSIPYEWEEMLKPIRTPTTFSDVLTVLCFWGISGLYLYAMYHS